MRPAYAALSLLLLAVLVLVADGATAGAATFCVMDPTCPAGGTPEPTIHAAYTAASAVAGLDRIQIGPGTFTEANLDLGEVELAGAGQTTITAPAAPGTTALRVEGPTSSVSDLTVRMPESSSGTGLYLVGGAVARRVAVTGSTTATGTGVVIDGASSFGSGSIALAAPADTTGADGSGSLVDSTVSAAVGVGTVGKVQRVRIVATSTGVRVGSILGADTTLDDVLVRLGGQGAATGISNAANAAFGGLRSTLTARHVTLIGNGNASSVGVDLDAVGFPPGSSPFIGGTAVATAALSGAIVRGFGTALATSANSLGTATIAIGRSDYPAASTDTTGGGTISASAPDLDADPRFADAANGDFSLRADSPLVDQADPAPLAAGESPTDLLGNPRVVDGNGDGSAVSDIGAFEYQPPRQPSQPLAPAPPARAPVLGQLALTHARFAVGSARAAAARRGHARPRRRAPRPPHGTTVYFTLSRAARVTFAVQRPHGGLRGHGTCLVPTRRLRRARARRCTRWTAVFRLVRASVSGANSVPFSGRDARGKPLARGPYRLLVTANADGRSSAPRTARFAIVRG